MAFERGTKPIKIYRSRHNKYSLAVFPWSRKDDRGLNYSLSKSYTKDGKTKFQTLFVGFLELTELMELLNDFISADRVRLEQEYCTIRDKKETDSGEKGVVYQ